MALRTKSKDRETKRLRRHNRIRRTVIGTSARPRLVVHRSLKNMQGHLTDGSVLLPLNYSGNWMHSNISSYLGTGKVRVVVLDHFTALAPFNPEQWNEAMKPYGPIGNFASSNQPCIHIAGYADSTGVAVDEVLTWKMDAAVLDSCLSDVQAQLEADYIPSASSPHGDAELFRHR